MNLFFKKINPIILFLLIFSTGCSPKADKTGSSIENKNPLAGLEVMDYCGRWEEMISAAGMELMDKTLGLGDVYQREGFGLDFGSEGKIECRNGECHYISISGVVLGDEKNLAAKKLERESWLYFNLPLDTNCDFYLTKRGGEYYYLQAYYSQDNHLVDHWYLYNRSEEETVKEACMGYDAFINADEAWKKEYIKYITETGMNYDSWTNSFSETYKLVDVNGDEIPELYINSGFTAEGDRICSYSNSCIISKNMWNYGFSYIEGQNLFMDSGGHMDMYHNIIYSMENGRFTLRGEGSFGAADNANIQYDAAGNIIYEYYWDNVKVPSEQEYQKKLHTVYDEQKAISPFDGASYDSEQMRYVGNGLCDYQEILDTIVDY